MYFIVTENRAIRSGCFIPFVSVHIVDAVRTFHVPICQNANDTGHFFSLCRIDLQNICMRNLCLHQSQMQERIRHFFHGICTEIPRSAGLRQCRGTRVAGSVQPLSLFRISEQRRELCFTAHNCSCCHNSVYVRLIAGAAAGISRLSEMFTYLRTRRIRVALQ